MERSAHGVVYRGLQFQCFQPQDVREKSRTEESSENYQLSILLAAGRMGVPNLQLRSGLGREYPLNLLLKLACTLESLGEICKLPEPSLHDRPIESYFLKVDPRCYHSKLMGFQCIATVSPKRYCILVHTFIYPGIF